MQYLNIIVYIYINIHSIYIYTYCRASHTGDAIRAESKTSMKGFSIRVHVGTPPRKQNLHSRKPRESSAKGVRQGRAAKAAAKAGR